MNKSLSRVEAEKLAELYGCTLEFVEITDRANWYRFYSQDMYVVCGNEKEYIGEARCINRNFYHWTNVDWIEVFKRIGSVRITDFWQAKGEKA